MLTNRPLMKTARLRTGATGETMDLRPIVKRTVRRAIPLLFASLMLQGCVNQWGAKLQMDSKSQILMSDSSQVRLRSIQSRVFDTTDKLKIMDAAVAAMQDLYFDIDVLDEDLGVISGKKLFHDDDKPVTDPTYYIVQDRRTHHLQYQFPNLGSFQLPIRSHPHDRDRTAQGKNPIPGTSECPVRNQGG